MVDMKKIAIVEDNPDNRLLVNAILSDYYKITEYETGMDALKGFQKDIPDLIILDISLPMMDGEEVLKRIREDVLTKDIPVIALTAHAMIGDREKYISKGFNEYVEKPIIDEMLLFDAINKLIRTT